MSTMEQNWLRPKLLNVTKMMLDYSHSRHHYLSKKTFTKMKRTVQKFQLITKICARTTLSHTSTEVPNNIHHIFEMT